MEWRDLGDGRLCFEHPDGFTVIKPNDGREPVPLLCPICGLAMLTSDDAASHRKHGCCSMCQLKWVDARHDEWASGWRPSSDDVMKEVQRRMQKRPLIRF